MLDFHLVIGSGVLATKHFLPRLAVHEGDFSIGDLKSQGAQSSAGSRHARESDRVLREVVGLQEELSRISRKIVARQLRVRFESAPRWCHVHENRSETVVRVLVDRTRVVVDDSLKGTGEAP